MGILRAMTLTLALWNYIDESKGIEDTNMNLNIQKDR
jgi:hypothetical protein